MKNAITVSTKDLHTKNKDKFWFLPPPCSGLVIIMCDVGRKFLVGTSEFDKFIEQESLFVDKTLFIKEFIEGSDEVTVILRPRRLAKA